MTNVRLDESNVLEIPSQQPASIDAFFVFGLHKCGSSLMNKIFVNICKRLDIPCLSIPDTLFKQGIPTSVWDQCSILNSVICDGYCHRGFRHYPMFLTENELLPKRKKILLVRDPRDAIVSGYFSFAKSHRLPESGQLLDEMLELRQALKNIEIEDYAVANAPNVKAAFNQYTEHIAQDSLLKVYRYEDIIFDKANWIADMLQFLNLSLNNAQISKIADQHNIIPKTEDISQHIRKVKPGDHREKLSPECIAKLNDILGEVLERYDYPY